MGDSGFDLIAQEVLKQQQLMDTLQKENRELRRQLTELRAGKGIFLEIAGKRFALGNTMQAASETTAPKNPPSSASGALTPQQLEASVAAGTKAQEKPKADTPSFLEEIMIDEFSSAMTSPMVLRKEPTHKSGSDEKQQADLRRELMGSYLLE